MGLVIKKRITRGENKMHKISKFMPRCLHLKKWTLKRRIGQKPTSQKDNDRNLARQQSYLWLVRLQTNIHLAICGHLYLCFKIKVQVIASWYTLCSTSSIQYQQNTWPSTYSQLLHNSYNGIWAGSWKEIRTINTFYIFFILWFFSLFVLCLLNEVMIMN